MGLTFRKSVKIGSGTRLNFSSSGIGISTGVKGFRVSTGPRGTYVTIGGHGIYYREKIAGPYGISQNTDVYDGIKTAGSEQIVPSADALQLVNSDAFSTLAKINETVNLSSSWPSTTFLVLFPLVVVSTVILLASFPHIFVLTFVTACVVAVALTSITINNSAQQDTARRTYSLDYDLDNLAQTRYQSVLDAVAILVQNNKIRCVVSSYNTPDTKYNAGADSFERTLNASCSSTQLPFIKTNVTPICLDLGNGNQKLYFLPDKVYVYQKGKEIRYEYGAVEYSDISFNFYTKKMAMDPVVAPNDSEVLGKTYEKVNKDGTRDKRFAHNQELIICRVGRIEVTSPQGLNVLLEVSKASTAQEFVEAFQHMVSNIPIADETNSSVAQKAAEGPPLPHPTMQPEPNQPYLAVPDPTVTNPTVTNPTVPVEGGYLPCPQCGFLNTPLDEICIRCHTYLSNVFGESKTHIPPASSKEEPVRQEPVFQQTETKEAVQVDTEANPSRLLIALHSKDKLERLMAAMGLCATRETEFIKPVLSIMDKITWDEVDDLAASL